jgi:hypothetical protein
MYQWALSFIYIISLFFSLTTTVTFAQSFGNPTKTPVPGSSLSVMSAEDFKKAVDAASQKNQEKLTQDVQDQFRKRATLPATTPITTPATIKAAPDALPPPTTTTSGPLTGTTPSTEPASNSDHSGLLTTAPAAPTSTPPRPNTQTPTTITTPPPAQSSVYTGFGPGNTNKTPTNTNSSSTNEGGWNIKY